ENKETAVSRDKGGGGEDVIEVVRGVQGRIERRRRGKRERVGGGGGEGGEGKGGGDKKEKRSRKKGWGR
ncbi:hypothetical protein, partial [Bacillus subtilis]|uniref:hypothetical protein n=1 Tax=Bacillus subtilis TaxID=1423 RepID=UPI001BDBA51F